MRSDFHLARIAVVTYSGSQSSAVFGLADLFETANRFQREKASTIAFDIVQTHDLLDIEPPTAIILPPSLAGEPGLLESQSIGMRLRDYHQRGTLVCSVCAGAFILARTGLINARPATTHWALGERFRAAFPDVNLDVDKLIIDDGDIITAGGLMAWVDLGLALVERFTSPSVMLATARFFLVDPSGREQRFYTSFTPRLNHGDGAILHVQHWLQTHIQDKITISKLAHIAGMGERTFLRRFKAATEFKPTEYLQQVRVAKARDHLELSRMTVDDVAWAVGYEDTSAFRRVFQKLIGLTPSDYRQRFSARGRAGAIASADKATYPHPS